MQSRAGHPASSYCHRKNTGAASGFLSRMGASGLHLWGRCREEADLIWFCLFECLGLIALDVGRVVLDVWCCLARIMFLFKCSLHIIAAL